METILSAHLLREEIRITTVVDKGPDDKVHPKQHKDKNIYRCRFYKLPLLIFYMSGVLNDVLVVRYRTHKQN